MLMRATSIRNEASSALVSEYVYTYDGNGNRLSRWSADKVEIQTAQPTADDCAAATT